MKTLIELLLPMNLYSIIGDQSVYGTGKSHLQNDNSESSLTLCGKDLGMKYQQDHDRNGRMLTCLNEADVVYHAEQLPMCKTCIKIMELKNL